MMVNESEDNFASTSTPRNAISLVVSCILDALRTILFAVGIHPRYIAWRSKQFGTSMLKYLGLLDKRNEESQVNPEENELQVAQKGPDTTKHGRAFRRNRRRREVGDHEHPISRQGASYPGMVNLSGTLCYMNSVLQSFASLAYLHRYLVAIVDAAEVVDLPTGVVDNLMDILHELNRPSSSSSPSPLRPNALISNLSLLPSVRRLLSTREHQDAHELFLLLTSAVGDEEGKVRVERGRKERQRGLGWATDVPEEGRSIRTTVSTVDNREDTPQASTSSSELDKPAPIRIKSLKSPPMQPRLISPFEGLSANRRACLECGWCESIRYETMGPLDVAVPMSGHISLHSCIRHFTKIETLSATCDRCTLRLTTNYYKSEAERLATPPLDENSNHTTPAVIPPSRKKRAREARKILKTLEEMRDANDLSDMERREGLRDAKWVKTASRNTKQAMIARPPPVLCLHLVRSEYTNYGQVVKKTPFVAYPSILDVTDFTTTGTLRMTSDGPISGLVADWDEAPAAGTSSDPDDRPPLVLYRLDALICHYGFTHSFGHFVSYRRIPTSSSGPDIIRKSCPDYCKCDDCESFGQVRWKGTPGRGWLRISDADVEEVGESEVLGERGSAFLLFYERIQEYQGGAERSTKPHMGVMAALKAKNPAAAAKRTLDDLI